MGLKHRKVSLISDEADATAVRPSDWGSASTDYATAPTHVFDGGAMGGLLYRDTGAVDGASWIEAAEGILACAGAGQVPAFTTSPTLEDLTITGEFLIAHPTTPEIHFGNATLPVGRGWWASGIDQAASVPLRDYVVAAKGYTFSVTDGVTTNADATLTSATANFTSAAIGYAVVGAGIPNGTTIASVTNATTVELSANATATATGVSLTFSKAGQTVNDTMYVSHNGFADPTVGIGKPQPSTGYRLYVQSGDRDLTQGSLKILATASQTGDLLSADNQNHVNAFRLKSDGSLQVDASSATAFQVRNNAGTPIFVVDTSGAGASAFAGLMNIGSGAAPTATLDIVGTSTNSVDLKMRTVSWGSFRILVAGATPGLTTLGTANGTPMAFQTNGTERMRLLTGGHAVLTELAADPSAADLTSGANAKDRLGFYMKNDKLVFAYNNAGTVTYISIPLDGSTTTWTHSTSAP